MAKKTGRGGKREGAGRPPKRSGLTPLYVRISQALNQRLARSAARAGKTLQDHVAELLQRGLDAK